MVGSNCWLELPCRPCLQISQMYWVTYGLITMFNFLHSWLATENIKKERGFAPFTNNNSWIAPNRESCLFVASFPRGLTVVPQTLAHKIRQIFPCWAWFLHLLNACVTHPQDIPASTQFPATGKPPPKLLEHNYSPSKKMLVLMGELKCKQQQQLFMLERASFPKFSEHVNDH